jgi:hypothetical protein
MTDPFSCTQADARFAGADQKRDATWRLFPCPWVRNDYAAIALWRAHGDNQAGFGLLEYYRQMANGIGATAKTKSSCLPARAPNFQ